MKKVLFYLFTLLISTNIVFAEHLDNEMNVMSFNIRMSTKSDGLTGWEYRKDLAANVIKFYDVDMFGAQESCIISLTDLLDRFAGLWFMSGWGVKMVRQKVSILLSFTEGFVSLLSKVAISGWRKI